MINKNLYENSKKSYIKNLFMLVTFTYVIGICIGCSFTLKNSENITFVTKVTGITNLSSSISLQFNANALKFFIRDILAISAVLILKYSGILKSLTTCVPLFIAIQNASIYSVLYVEKELNILQILSIYILKDTLCAFILILFVTITLLEIMKNNAYDIKNDIKFTSYFALALTIIYFIYYIIKTLIY